MIKRQKKMFIAGLLGILLCGLFPPWLNVLDVPYHAHQRTPAGHEFILMPPESKGGAWSVQIDMNTLLVEWVCIISFFGIIIHLMDRPEKLLPPPNNKN